jgi:hypothetical protein
MGQNDVFGSAVGGDHYYAIMVSNYLTGLEVLTFLPDTHVR